jgi:ABC-type dipeptide/oligopeptide/nickel transport system ATPase component
MGMILDVQDLRTHFFTPEGVVKAVDGVSYNVSQGETMALVGESGCGKSVSALSIMRLISFPPGRIVGGTITFNGVDLSALSDEEMRKVRGKEIAMVFQEPMTSLNPVLTIGRQLTETLEVHLRLGRAASAKRAMEVLRLVGIPDPERRLSQYPHQFSGGMRQRVMIAMALICEPKLILADEPTTALDVTIQAQVLELMKELSRRLRVAMIIITHNLGVVARYADRVNVMYAGKVIESGKSQAIVPGIRTPLGFSIPFRDWTSRARRNWNQFSGNLPTLSISLPGAVSSLGAALRMRDAKLRSLRCEIAGEGIGMPAGGRKISALPMGTGGNAWAPPT